MKRMKLFLVFLLVVVGFAATSHTRAQDEFTDVFFKGDRLILENKVLGDYRLHCEAMGVVIAHGVHEPNQPDYQPTTCTNGATREFRDIETLTVEPTFISYIRTGDPLVWKEDVDAPKDSGSVLLIVPPHKDEVVVLYTQRNSTDHHAVIFPKSETEQRVFLFYVESLRNGTRSDIQATTQLHEVYMYSGGAVSLPDTATWQTVVCDRPCSVIYQLPEHTDWNYHLSGESVLLTYEDVPPTAGKAFVTDNFCKAKSWAEELSSSNELFDNVQFNDPNNYYPGWGYGRINVFRQKFFSGELKDFPLPKILETTSPEDKEALFPKCDSADEYIDAPTQQCRWGEWINDIDHPDTQTRTNGCGATESRKKP